MILHPTIISDTETIANMVIRIIGSISSIIVVFELASFVSRAKIIRLISKFGRISLEFYYVHLLLLMIPIFQTPLKSRDQKSFIYETLNKTIFSLIQFFKFSTKPRLFILDQYKPRYDYYNSIINNLKAECKENNHLKFIACSSNNEIDIREIIYNSLFNDSIEA